jgi:hypothetical protein
MSHYTEYRILEGRKAPMLLILRGEFKRLHDRIDFAFYNDAIEHRDVPVAEGLSIACARVPEASFFSAHALQFNLQQGDPLAWEEALSRVVGRNLAQGLIELIMTGSYGDVLRTSPDSWFRPDGISDAICSYTGDYVEIFPEWTTELIRGWFNSYFPNARQHLTKRFWECWTWRDPSFCWTLSRDYLDRRRYLNEMEAAIRQYYGHLLTEPRPITA